MPAPMCSLHADMSCAAQVDALIDEYFNSGDIQEASTTLQVCLSAPSPPCAAIAQGTAEVSHDLQISDVGSIQSLDRREG